MNHDYSHDPLVNYNITMHHLHILLWENQLNFYGHVPGRKLWTTSRDEPPSIHHRRSPSVTVGPQVLSCRAQGRTGSAAERFRTLSGFLPLVKPPAFLEHLRGFPWVGVPQNDQMDGLFHENSHGWFRVALWLRKHPFRAFQSHGTTSYHTFFWWNWSKKPSIVICNLGVESLSCISLRK